VVTKLREVDRAVEEIMGIDRNQFTQIAMIAQGDFLKLLLASTDDRKRIFQKIFRTRCYYVLQEKLKSESGKLGREYENISASIRQYIDGIKCDEDDVLSIKVRNAKAGMSSTEETLELLSMLIENDRIEEEKLDGEQKVIIKSLDEITVTLTNHETWSKARKSLKKSKSDNFEWVLETYGDEIEIEGTLLCSKDSLTITLPALELDGEELSFTYSLGGYKAPSIKVSKPMKFSEMDEGDLEDLAEMIEENGMEWAEMIEEDYPEFVELIEMLSWYF